MKNMDKEKNEDMWVVCPECKTKLKKENISAHLKHVHDKKAEDVDASSTKVLPKKRKQQKPKRSKAVIAGVLVVLLVIVASMLFLFSGSTDSPNSNGNHSNGSSWLESYSPVHSLSTGNDGFWIDHPLDGPITHPQWLIDSLQNNCVVFVIHRHTCAWCDPQAQRVIALGEKYKDRVVFYDLDIDLGGDIELKGYDSLIYDPDGAPHYIALTGIFTLIEKDGQVEYGWHAWEGDMEESDIEDCMKDAIYYHQRNKGD